MGNKWPGIQDQIQKSKKEISVLPVDQARRKAVRERQQIDRTSTLGTVLYNAGGIVVEHWIRIYGVGALDFEGRKDALPVDSIVVGEDVLGGLFAGMEDGTIGYFSPSTLIWEPLHLSYPQFLDWCFLGDTQMFYGPQRWSTWEADAAALSLDEGFAFQPELWRLGRDTEERERRAVPVVQLACQLLETARQRRERAQRAKEHDEKMEE